MFLGVNTHALSVPAHASALEVLTADGVDVMIARDEEYTPTPAVSHAILKYNRFRTAGLADGIVVTQELGEPAERRVQAAATPKQKALLARLSPRQFRHTRLAGETIERVLDRAPGNDAPIGGVKVITKSAWFAARPPGTEHVYKIYAESFRGEDQLERVVAEAQAMVATTLLE